MTTSQNRSKDEKGRPLYRVEGMWSKLLISKTVLLRMNHAVWIILFYVLFSVVLHERLL